MNKYIHKNHIHFSYNTLPYALTICTTSIKNEKYISLYILLNIFLLISEKLQQN